MPRKHAHPDALRRVPPRLRAASRTATTIACSSTRTRSRGKGAGDDGGQASRFMRKKTSNAQRPTPNIQFGKWRVAEVSNGENSATRNPAYDLEDRFNTCCKEVEELIRIFVASVRIAERNAK